MAMNRIALLLVAAALLASPWFAEPARAADVDQSLFAQTFAWHVGTAGSGSTQISVAVGDTLHLRIENLDSAAHTFTAPQFPAASGQGGSGNFLDITLAPGAVFVWNFTLRSTDAGTWQYYCIPHSSGTYPNRAGMVGTIVVSGGAPPPPTPGFEALAAIGALATAFVIVRRRRT